MSDATTAVRWRVFDQTLTDARSRFADVLIDAAERRADIVDPPDAQDDG